MGETMSRWTHAICQECWDARHLGTDPVRANETTEEVCCFCGLASGGGIYIREDPANTICGGKTGIHEGDNE